MLKRKAYLTIDDSPSPRMDDLVDALLARKVPAVFFCRGDYLEQYFDSGVRAIEKGFVLGNHSYSHPRSSLVSFDDFTAEIARTQAVIDRAYEVAGVVGDPKLFRFPHMDRGMGGWIVDYDDLPDSYRDSIMRLFGDGLNIHPVRPDKEARDKKDALQDWLLQQGFTTPAFEGLTFPWYTDTEIGRAADAMFTYSTADWMVTARHKGKWPWKTVADLERKMDEDPFLQQGDSAHVLLAHDQAEIFDETLRLIDYGLATGLEFHSLAQRTEKLWQNGTM